MKHPIKIAGGGLAGLSLGIALRCRDIPVTLYEAGHYPRHRVCGEFLCGAGRGTLRSLEIEEFWNEAVPNFSSGWYERTGSAVERRLPCPALGLSRRRLDAGLAARFRALGGELVEGRRFTGADEPGTVWATGRKGGGRSWLGLKAHFQNLLTRQDLEMHFGRNAYVGLSRIENGTVNVCGLFARRSEVHAPKENLLAAYLRAGGLEGLAGRLDSAARVPGSETAVTGLDFTGKTSGDPALRIGDSYAAIPPFTGNGMSVALESAAVSVAPLAAYSGGSATWEEASRDVRRRLDARFARRLQTARALHPFLLNPGRRRVLFLIARARLLPFNFLFHTLR